MAFELPTDLRHARILLSNDDGINAPGLAVLERIARSLSDDVWIVAPETEQSASSHSLTLQRPLRLREINERRFAVDGTPTDCALLAINLIMRERKPDLVLSGVNFGRNISDDITYSGTIAVAMEATLLGVPAIAMSQAVDASGSIDWSAAESWGPQLIRRVAGMSWPDTVLVNINFPAVPADQVTGIQVVPHGKRKIADEVCERVDPRGRTYYWVGPLYESETMALGTDLAVVSGGGIAITPLHLDLTHGPTLESLRLVFAQPTQT
ncbi:MAG: 5'/3'-nucleotidase SurE [Rhodospirillaceae bacterium]